jgi:peptidoglycan hydrolase CwlO-like protein
MFYTYAAFYTVIVIAVVYITTKKFFCNSVDKRELAEVNLENLPIDLQKLLSKLEFLEKKIIRLTDKLNTLQTTSNISKEQLDYATTNLNGLALAP